MIKYLLTNSEWNLQRGTIGASGYDLKAALGEGNERKMYPGERWLVPTGLYLSMPLGVEAQVRSRSGLAINHGVIVLNAPGTVDSDYRGEVKVSLINLGSVPFTIVPGERIAQLVFCPVLPEYIQLQRSFGHAVAMEMTRVYAMSELGDTARGAGGHGSTGR